MKIALFSIGLFSACNTDSDINALESGIIGKENFESKHTTIGLQINNIEVSSIQGNGLSTYALGQLTQGDFGKTTASIVAQVLLPSVAPTFGVLSQENEGKANNYNENETVEKVYLYLPFFYKESNQTNSENKVEKVYTLDSIYGTKTASFTISVDEIDYNLRDTGTDLNPQVYYSDLTIPKSTNLASTTVNGVSNQPIVRYQFDDPLTTDDESKKEKDRLTPGIRIELEKSFFQTHLLDKEGSNTLSTNALFLESLKGIAISTSNFSADLWPLFDFSKAKVEVEYSYIYKRDNKQYTRKNLFELNLNGIILNLFENTGKSVTASSSDIYLKGNVGYVAEISIQEDDAFTQLKNDSPLITEADLIFYVNKDKIEEAKMPQYLAVFNSENGNVLVDYTNDLSVTNGQQITSISKIQKDSNGDYFYKVRINDHLTNILKGNSQNVKLGLAVSSGNVAAFMANKKYKDTSSNVKNTVTGDVITPLYTVIYGSTTTDQTKKPILKVYYSKAK
ncbi:MAG: DUF4270 domain-containing protein [Capnocytophaga sp.]|nr:DUF4270 domain-containing protein [Capnocytophaga sp.]